MGTRGSGVERLTSRKRLAHGFPTQTVRHTHDGAHALPLLGTRGRGPPGTHSSAHVRSEAS